MTDQDRFCARCGQQVGGTQPSQASFTPREPLARDVANKKIAGVCAGIAHHFGWDVTIIRVLFLAGILAHGFGLLAYIIGWIAMPASAPSMRAPSQSAA
ncbi:MAG: PspC domain-containing protein [Acidobacteria bacterium]|nr:PspC domain-containing protein [Acidobacteriota bacterium]